jgi:hypothetical protein
VSPRAAAEPQLRAHPSAPVGVELLLELADRCRREVDRASLVRVEQGQQGLGEPGKVPLGHAGLVAERVSAGVVDRAEDGARVVGLEEGTRSVVDGLAGDGHVVGVHHAVDEADEHPLRHQPRLRSHHRVEQREGWQARISGCRVEASDRVVAEAPQQVAVAGRGGVLEAADTQVAARDAREHRAGQEVVPLHGTSGRDHGQGPGGRDAQGLHRLTDGVLPQHRPQHREPVAPAGERGAPRPLQVHVAPSTRRVGQLAEQQGATVAEARREAPELVAGIGLSHWSRVRRDE